MFVIVAAVGKNRELGKDNDLIFHLKEDMRFFRKTTTGHKVVMGRKTWESLPGKLKNRENIVVSRQNFPGPDLIIHDLPNFITKNQATPEEIFIIGGASTYESFLPYAKKLYLTEIAASTPDATVFFPNFDQSHYAKTVIKEGKEDDLAYQIIKYIKN